MSQPRAPKIALVIDRFDGRRGGASLWTRGFANWLAARNCDVHVLARSFGLIESLLPITRHTIDAPRSPLAFAREITNRLEMIRPLVSHDMGAAIGCDVFQPHVGSLLACWEGSVASCVPWLRPIKRLCHLAPRYQRIRRLAALQYAGGSQAFVAVSQKVAHDLQALHAVPAKQTHVVYNGIDLHRFAPWMHRHRRAALRSELGVGAHEILIVALAHHARLKGIPLLVQAVHQLRRRGAPTKLLICGALSKLPEPGGAILRCGNVEDTAPLYVAADLCVHPTFYDACSLVTLEALASGLPVVTTRANGASELITSGANGLILEGPIRAEVLTDAIEPLIDDAELRRTLGAAARRLMNTHSDERNYQEIVAVYTQALITRDGNNKALEPLLQAMEENFRRQAKHAETSLVGL